MDGRFREGLFDLLTGEDGCDLLVIVSPSCPVSGRMRINWRYRFSAWRDSVGVDIRPIWLGSGTSDEFRAFTTGFPLEGISLTHLPVKGTGIAYESLGVIGTPTVYLVDTSGKVEGGVLGDRFPPVDLARRSCPR